MGFSRDKTRTNGLTCPTMPAIGVLLKAEHPCSVSLISMDIQGTEPGTKGQDFAILRPLGSTKSGTSVLCVLDIPHYKKRRYVETVRMMGLPRSPLAGTDGLTRMDTLPTLVDGPISSFDRFHQPRLHATPVLLWNTNVPRGPPDTQCISEVEGCDILP